VGISLKIRVTFSQWHVSFISNSLDLPNAALRGECRINQASADNFTTKTNRIPKMPRGMNPA
ncbi:hypothetical protein, partial [Vibrio vulnificus]|uniref:hypothetical protein n=1 Tax=Vibrio vulnificus TaxID=672 RepID=UPI003F64A0FA